MMEVHQQLPEPLMKSVLVFASLSLISACALAAEPTEEQKRADAMVKEKEVAQRAATVKHFRREAALAKTSYGPTANEGYGFSRIDRLEREQKSTAYVNGQVAFLRDRVTNDVAER
jgi:hypothetical protein